MAASDKVSLCRIKRQDLLEVWRNKDNKENQTNAIFSYIVRNLNLDDSLDIYEEKLRSRCDSIRRQIQQKWRKSHSSLTNFKHKYSQWLDGYFTFEDIIEAIQGRRTSRKPIGRPKTAFTEASESTKRRRIQPLLQASTEELSFATQSSLHSRGLRTAASIVKQVSESPEAAHELKKSCQPQKLPIKLTADEALASFVKNKLTKSQYIAIHCETKNQNADVYPIYADVLAAKKRCYPENITVTELSTEVQLQSLLDHTVRRLMVVQEDVLLRIPVSLESPSPLKAVYKWGCDGAAGQQNYKQRFTEDDSTDSFLFVISCVPVRLVSDHDVILWQNQRPSSTAFCRPIKLIFHKETEQLVREEVANVQAQISQLRPTEVSVGSYKFQVTHSLNLTMIDGKIGGILTKTPSSKCFICNANPKAMNDLQSHRQRVVNQAAIAFGLSSLHVLIKCFECILHISYRLEIQQWQVRQQHKESVNTRKRTIQDRLRKEMGLLVDIPKPGFGNTNDGNTARRFFLEPQQAARITGVDETLIFRLSILLRTLSCGFEIDSEKFGKYAFETAQHYVSLYNWYYMPPTMHKVLIHGAEIIKSFIVPIGQMSEEAQEAKHKDLKRFRRDNARKMSRKATMEDMMNMAMITSDPLISSLSPRKAKKSGPLPLEVINLLKCSNVSNEVNLQCETESDESD